MRRLLLALLLLTVGIAAPAQDYKVPEIEISTEKANIAGKTYYIHKVLPKQTQFSICKAYGITEDEFVAANPDLKQGSLKAGSIVFIPVKETEAEKEGSATRTTANAQAVEESLPEDVSPQEVKSVIEHRVRWFESLASIARKYSVTVEELADYNGLKPGENIHGKVLVIPVIGEREESDEEESVEAIWPGQTTVEDPSGNEGEDPMAPVRKIRWFNADEPLHVALVLPFNAEGAASGKFLNFYSGALMAVRDQKDRGAHLVLNVYDLAKGADAIFGDSKFAMSDIIIGPVEKETVTPFVEYADKNGIPFVSPLDHKVDSLVEGHPFLFQVPAGTEVQVRNLAGSLHYNHRDRVYLVHSNTTGEAAFIRSLEEALAAEGVSYRKLTLPELTSLLSGLGSRSETIKVVLASENRTMAASTISELNTHAKRGVPMEVWCTNRVRNMETSDPDAFFNIGTHTAAPYFVDYTDARDKDFVLQYRALFSDEPDDFAFQGYDVMTYFISAMMQHGTAFCDNADSTPMQLLHCNFEFRRPDAESGWRNYATRNLTYNKEDFSITLSK